MLECLTLLARAPALGSSRSLTKVKAYLRTKGNPHYALRVLHVTGTNGKGSVCNMLAQVLFKEFGQRVGVFTSPHLIRINERIKVQEREISDSDLARWVANVLRDQPQDDPFTFFELITLVAIHYFLEQKVEITIFEVGVGGTHDTTNVRKTPLATCITSVSMDHLQLLGPTLTQIQWNKMGIMKKGVPCYTTVDNPLMHFGARRKHALLHIIDDTINTSLLGAHQQKNAALVYHILYDLGYDPKRIRTGLQDIAHPGRLQFLTPHILLDGAHNAEGIQVLGEYVSSIRDQYPTLITVFATTKSTQHLTAFAHLLLQGDKNFVVSTEQFNQKMIDGLPFPVQTFEDMHAVIRYLRTIKKGLVVVYGSLYLIGALLKEREQ